MKKEANLYTFRIIIEPEKDGGYHGFVPILKGLHTFGDDIADIKKNLKEAIICHKGKDIKSVTLRGIIKDINLTVEEFIKILKK